MIGGDALETFAAISIGIAGFSAIVVALVADRAIHDKRRLHWGLGLLFCWALGAVFFSVLPFILFYFAVPEQLIWQSGLLVMGSYVAGAGGVALLVDRRLNNIGLDIKGRQRDRPVRRSREMALAKVLYCAIAVMLWLTGVWLPIPGFYLVGMTVMLILSVWVLLFFFFLTGLLHRGAGISQQHDERR